jgi:putative tryptophan/tyrosine transport system substrate-binding protein
VGVQTAGIVDQVLKGGSPGSIPVIFASGTDLQVNKATAAAIGIELPQAVLDRATKVIE